MALISVYTVYVLF
jgi:hypothetical protein